MPGLRIDVDWRAGAIADVSLRADLPKASAVLAGRTPAEALQLLALLYAVCGRAQRAASELALCAAGGPATTPTRRAELALGVASEAVVEHLWRLLVDWPRKLGVSTSQDRFAHWYRRIASPAPGWQELERELAGEWLAVPLDWLDGWHTLREYDGWLDASPAPLARTFAALRAADPASPRGAAPSREAGAPLRDHGVPRSGGERQVPVAETGAVEQYADHPWVGALLASGRGLEARIAARLVGATSLVASLARPADADAEVELDATSPAERCGRAAVQTARGMLVHDVRLDGDRIVTYAIRTPTEINFAADGAYRALLAGRASDDAAAARRVADLWALALDPCVPYEVHGGVAGHA